MILNHWARTVGGALLCGCMAGVSLAGEICFTIDGPAPAQVFAVQRRQTDEGVFEDLWRGVVNGNDVTITDLPTGRYDVRLLTASGGLIQGWDATVPASDFEVEQPLQEASMREVRRKLAGHVAKQFFDECLVLDVAGNAQHAAVLVTQLRRRAFVGGGYKGGEWVWRVDRWEYESEDGQTWVPLQERPFYSIFRERLMPKDYQARRIAFLRELGGIDLREPQSTATLGRIRVVEPEPGIIAWDAQAQPRRPVIIKPLTQE